MQFNAASLYPAGNQPTGTLVMPTRSPNMLQLQLVRRHSTNEGSSYFIHKHTNFKYVGVSPGCRGILVGVSSVVCVRVFLARTVDLFPCFIAIDRIPYCYFNYPYYSQLNYLLQYLNRIVTYGHVDVA